MKRLSIVLLLITVFFMQICACAQEDGYEAAPSKAVGGGIILKDGRSGNYSRSDLVEIDGDRFAVLTAESIGIAYERENSGIYVLTQDYIRQAELFADFYDDPLNAVMEFVELGIHLNVYDNESGIDIYVSVYEMDWCSDYPNTEEITEDEAELMLMLMAYDFSDKVNSSFRKIGNIHYFVFDECEASEHVFLYASVGGHLIRIDYATEEKWQVERGLELLENLIVVKMDI